MDDTERRRGLNGLLAPLKLRAKKKGSEAEWVVLAGPNTDPLALAKALDTLGMRIDNPDQKPYTLLGQQMYVVIGGDRDFSELARGRQLVDVGVSEVYLNYSDYTFERRFNADRATWEKYDVTFLGRPDRVVIDGTWRCRPGRFHELARWD